jgi:hypothetical protein
MAITTLEATHMSSPVLSPAGGAEGRCHRGESVAGGVASPLPWGRKVAGGSGAAPPTVLSIVAKVPRFLDMDSTLTWIVLLG